MSPLCPAQEVPAAGKLKLHGIFASNMVLQRGKPIVVWGWAESGKKVTVRRGSESAEATAAGDKGRWEVSFPAREASAEPLVLAASTEAGKIELSNIVVGDVWVMTGQSNMAFGPGKVLHSDIKIAQSRLPQLRLFPLTLTSSPRRRMTSRRRRSQPKDGPFPARRLCPISPPSCISSARGSRGRWAFPSA